MPRALDPRLKAFLDAKVAVAAHDHLGVLAPWQYLVMAAHSCLGVIEEGGDNKGAMVELFQSTCGTPQGQAWCLDFVQSMLAWVEQMTGLKSPLNASEGVVPFWLGSPPVCRVTWPQPGDIVCYEFGTTGLGHCGIVIGNVEQTATLKVWQTIEGNTGPSGIIEREGDGVYLKSRKRGGSDSFRELGFLRPFV